MSDLNVWELPNETDNEKLLVDLIYDLQQRVNELEDKLNDLSDEVRYG